MIQVHFFKKDKKIIGFKIEGHSHYYQKLINKIKKKLFGKVKSKDYICSAVSSVSYMTVLGLHKVLKKRIDYKVNDSGYLECSLKEKADEKSENLFQSFYLALEEIIKEYPGHMTIVK